MDLPAWVAELTDPRRATTRDELADRLTPLAEHAIDVSRRLQTQLHDLNAPFEQESLHAVVDRLKARTAEAIEEAAAELAKARAERLDRIQELCDERTAATVEEPAEPAQPAEPGEPGEPGAPAGSGDRVRALLETEIEPELVRQEQRVVEEITARTAAALRESTRVLLARIDELAIAVTGLIHEVLPLAHEGLGLASRISGLSGRARTAGRGPIDDELAAEAEATVQAFDESIARLELEWSALGARSATVRSALRGAEETAFSQVTYEMTDCVAALAAAHVKAMNDTESRALELLEEQIGG